MTGSAGGNWLRSSGTLSEINGRTIEAKSRRVPRIIARAGKFDEGGGGGGGKLNSIP